MKAYYAHFMGIYNTPQEKRDIDTLEALGLTVVNPNNEHVSESFEAVKNMEGMSYLEAFEAVFFTLIDECEVFAFKALPDGRIPGGVAMELKYAQEHNKIIIELPSGTRSRMMDGEQTREYLKDIGQR